VWQRINKHGTEKYCAFEQILLPGHRQLDTLDSSPAASGSTASAEALRIGGTEFGSNQVDGCPMPLAK